MPIHFKPFIQDLPLTIESIGNNWNQEPIHRPRGHSMYHWLQTESGRGIVRIQNRELSLNAGEGILIAPQIPHQYLCTSHKWITSFITFSGTLANDASKICGEAPYLFIHAEDGEYFRDWTAHTIDSYLKKEMNDLQLSVNCYEFFMHFSSIYENDTLSSHPLYLQYIDPTIREIETRYADTLDVSALASDIHITPQYLTRLFQRFTGCSVRSYITRFRINKAKELLIGKPYLKIQNICYLTGFNDVSYFTSVFKEQTGVTPREFRRSYI